MNSSNHGKAKIVSTLGPSTKGVETAVMLIEAGMDVARLNFSHGTHDDHCQALDDLRIAAKQTGACITVLQDLQGPKIRIGKYKQRTGYKRHTGFRASLTQIEIESIGAAKRSRTKKAEGAEPAAEEAPKRTRSRAKKTEEES